MHRPAIRARHTVWRRSTVLPGDRILAEETAVALTYNGGSYAVMMATPRDLEDFAVGFSLTEGLVSSAQDIVDLEIVTGDLGIELRMWLKDAQAATMNERRRHLAGPTGCGVCGIESLAEAVKPPRRVSAAGTTAPEDISRAVDALGPCQDLNLQTRAAHAAGFWRPNNGFLAVREDVGRHNALDKLAGALARANHSGCDGMVVLTSRVSVELVQKAAAMDVPVIVAISAPTALAVRTAEAAGITLVAVARQDGFEVFTHPERIAKEAPAHVA